jgi:hypothetical protein
VIQESKGANSPNIVGNHNVINIAPVARPTTPRGRLQIEDRSSKDTPQGISERIIFGNAELMDTYLIAIQIKDAKDNVVAAYREATGRVQPSLPVTIKQKNPLTVTIELTKEEASRAYWIAWQTENNRWRRTRWNKGVHTIDVSLGESIELNDKIEAEVIRAGTRGGAGGSTPDAK